MSDPVLADPPSGDEEIQAEPEVDGRRAPSPHQWWLLLGIALPVYAVMADTVGTLVVLADVGDELRASSSAIAWVLAAFALGFTGPYLWFVGVSHRGRPKAVAVGGALVFALGSLLAAPAQDIWWLVAARAVQGVGAAAFVAAASVLVHRDFPDDHEKQAIWLLGGAAAVAAVVGPVTAGALADEIGWRMIYLTDLPVLVVGAWMIAVFGPVDRSVPPAARDGAVAGPADPPAVGSGRSVALLTGGLVAFEVALVRDRSTALSVGVAVVALVAGAALLRAFVRREDVAPAPLMDMASWRHRSTVGFLLCVALTGAALGGSLLVAVLLSQHVLGERVIVLGLALAVFGVAAVGAAGLSELLVVRYPVRVPLVAGAVVAAGAAVLLARVGPGSTLSDLLSGLAVTGVGHGLVLGAGSMAVGRGAPLHGVGRHLVVARAAGAALGVGVATLVMKAVENDRLDEFFALSGASLSDAERQEAAGLLSSAPYSLAALKRMVPEAIGEVNRVAREATTSGARAALVVCAVLALIGAVAALAAPSGRESVADVVGDDR